MRLMGLILKQVLPPVVFLWQVAACTAFPSVEPPVSDNTAVRGLAAQAHADLEAGRVAGAAAGLERALRIEPRNPRLWLELARVRLAQGDSRQAESLATRALSFAGGDNRLRAIGWGLISEARQGRGDDAGAMEADKRRSEYER